MRAAAGALNGLYNTVVYKHTKGLCRMSKDGGGGHVPLFALLEESNIQAAVQTE
jgi:hypothetical protein